MKVISYVFTAALVLAASSLTCAQDRTDSIKVVHETNTIRHYPDNPEYYVDGVLLKKGGFIDMIKPADIAKIDVIKEGKGKIYITLKKDVAYSFVTLESLSNKYLKSKTTSGLLYTVDGKLITDAESMINEKDILSVRIAADQLISSLPGGKVTIFKILTKSKLNIDNANTTYIRGNDLGSR